MRAVFGSLQPWTGTSWLQRQRQLGFPRVHVALVRGYERPLPGAPLRPDVFEERGPRAHFITMPPSTW